MYALDSTHHEQPIRQWALVLQTLLLPENKHSLRPQPTSAYSPPMVLIRPGARAAPLENSDQPTDLLPRRMHGHRHRKLWVSFRCPTHVVVRWPCFYKGGSQCGLVSFL